MTCSPCSRKTLTYLIDTILVDNLRTVSSTSGPIVRGPSLIARRDSICHRALRSRLRRPYNTWSNDNNRVDDTYVPFREKTQTIPPLSSEIASSIPSLLHCPLANHDPAKLEEPKIELNKRSDDMNDFYTNSASASVATGIGMPLRGKDGNDWHKRPDRRLARKERNRDGIAARRRTRDDTRRADQSSKNQDTLETGSSASLSPFGSVEVPIDGNDRPAPKEATSASSEHNLEHSKTILGKLRREPWQVQKAALKAKFKDNAWKPRKRLSPEALEGIRALHAQYPDHFTTPALAEQFKVSPEAIRRILKSKWRPSEEEEQRRQQRWDKRGENIWMKKVDEGIHPPKKWREMGIGSGPRRKAQERLRTNSGREARL